MDDCIMIDNLVVFANHGVYKEEKTMGQRFVISMRLYADLYPAAKSDDLTKALNYAEICSFVTKFTQTHRCCLIEAAAVNIADALLKGYPRDRPRRDNSQKALGADRAAARSGSSASHPLTPPRIYRHRLESR